MKKLLFPIAILGMLFFASCGGNDPDEGTNPTNDDGPTAEELAQQAKLATVPDDMVALYMKSSGTKCPPCGGWGWDTHAAMIEQGGEYISPFTIHSANFVSYDFINEESNRIDGDLAINSWPSFIVNSGVGGKLAKLTVSGSTAQEVATNFLVSVDDVVSQEAVAGAALKWNVSNNTINVDVRTRFFQEMPEGQYYVSVWVDENLVQAPQAGYTNGTPYHKHVLRTALDGHAVYGVQINKDDAAVAKDALFETTHTGEFPEGAWDKANCKVTAIIWTVTGTVTKSYAVLNTSSATFE